jgi:hypothetical protein
LNLDQATQAITQLGVRDTFAFEERRVLNQFVEEALVGRREHAREIYRSRRKSIWLTHEQRLTEWSLAERALDLLGTVHDLGQPKFPSLEGIIHGYASNWRELDRHHRELEQAVNEWQHDHQRLGDLVNVARAEYFKKVEGLQAEFIRLVGEEGGHLVCRLLSNGNIFNRVVAPALEAGFRVA